MSEENPSLAELLEQEGLDRDTLRTVLASVHPVDLAEALDDVDLEDRVRIFELLEPDVAAQVLAAMPHDYKVELVERIGEAKLGGIIERMPDNAVADILDHLPRHKEKQVLQNVDTNKAVDLQVLRQYPAHTAGGRMTRNFVAVPADTTARQVIEQIQGAVDPHTVDFIYVTDETATVATSLGGALGPMLLHRLKMDPATACGPFVTMFNDLFGTSVYFLIASLLNFAPSAVQNL